jgi:hypothetical protein
MIIIDRQKFMNTNEDKEIEKKKKSCGNLRKINLRKSFRNK